LVIFAAELDRGSIVVSCCCSHVSICGEDKKRWGTGLKDVLVSNNNSEQNDCWQCEERGVCFHSPSLQLSRTRSGPFPPPCNPGAEDLKQGESLYVGKTQGFYSPENKVPFGHPKLPNTSIL
jgi:hypothetical protein